MTTVVADDPSAVVDEIAIELLSTQVSGLERAAAEQLTRGRR